jgi:hypothetical protein
MRSDKPSTANKAHERMQKEEEIVSRGQRWICQLLRRLGVIQEGSETSSARTPAAAAQMLRAAPPMRMISFQEEDQ